MIIGQSEAIGGKALTVAKMSEPSGDAISFADILGFQAAQMTAPSNTKASLDLSATTAQPGQSTEQTPVTDVRTQLVSGRGVGLSVLNMKADGKVPTGEATVDGDCAATANAGPDAKVSSDTAKGVDAQTADAAKWTGQAPDLAGQPVSAEAVQNAFLGAPLGAPQTVVSEAGKTAKPSISGVTPAGQQKSSSGAVLTGAVGTDTGGAKPAVTSNGQSGAGANAANLTQQAPSSAGQDLILQALGENAASDNPESLESIDADTFAMHLNRAEGRGETGATQQAARASNAPQMAAMVARIGEQILERFSGKTSTFEIRLDPPELGKVDVRVEVGADGKVMAVIAARDPTVVDALMRGAKTLENALMQAGLSLSEGGVQVQLDQRNASAFARDNDNNPDGKNAAPGLSDDLLAEAGTDASIVPVFESWSRRRLDLTA